ncbi:hypothetical protein J4N45_19210 [Vibrio sp. SCSIO 43140]|uniref:hypothetical protein n=1 Tax=Vibrio sp. SCSIO 43140 TaxID=2819100 RepID=UPI0020753394|nr:hypothetical protein [Vibrio sp. SCSIO 43140]USD63130.1 hypothetical protein J4N45_19210 [Vibrio sp. SCSIO 43140]
MNKIIVVGLTAALLVGCGEPKSQQEDRLAITQQNVSGAWQCDYKLTEIKTKVYVAYGDNGEFSGRVFLNFPIATGKGAARVELITSGHWSLQGSTITEEFEVLALDSNSSSGHELSETIQKELNDIQLLSTEVSVLTESSMVLVDAKGEETRCHRRQV